MKCFLAIVGVVALALGCAGGQSGKNEGQPSTSRAQELDGVVVAIAADRRTVTVDHERVSNGMASMRMDYVVEDPRLLEGVDPGRRFRGRFEERSGRVVITAMELLPGSPAK